MAKKKVNISDIVKLFKEVLERAELSSYFYVDRIILSKNKSDHNILIIPENNLWLYLIDSNEIDMKELDISNPDEYDLVKLFAYAKDLETDWIELSSNEMYEGKICNLKIDNFNDYKILINKDLFPLKLKKAEFNNIFYKVFYNPMILVLKKKFVYDIDECGFTILKLFKIL